jgi:hypothetical protein
MSTITNAPELFLGRDTASAMALGPRQFRSAANAVRFTMERTAPVSRHGAMLRSKGQTFGINQIRRFYERLSDRTALNTRRG